MARRNYRIILDNGGGITLQIGRWAHYFDGQWGNDAKEAAQCLRDYIRAGNTSGWEGHEEEAAECQPTAEEQQNGGYRVLHDAAELRADSAWPNERDLSLSMLGSALRAIPSARRSEASRANGRRPVRDGNRPRGRPRIKPQS